MMLSGTWTPLSAAIDGTDPWYYAQPSGNARPNTLGTMMLLPDGSVMIEGGALYRPPAPLWYALAPATGSGLDYADGTIARLGDSVLGREYFASGVVPTPNGPGAYVIGGEFLDSDIASYTPMGEIYDPQSDTWSSIVDMYGDLNSTHISDILDANSAVLPNGRILLGSQLNTQDWIYDPESGSWTGGLA